MAMKQRKQLEARNKYEARHEQVRLQLEKVRRENRRNVNMYVCMYETHLYNPDLRLARRCAAFTCQAMGHLHRCGPDRKLLRYQQRRERMQSTTDWHGNYLLLWEHTLRNAFKNQAENVGRADL